MINASLLVLCWLMPWPWGNEDSSVYTRKRPSPDGIGKVYLGREISHVMGYQGASWLERSSREREERPDLLVANMDLEADSVIADIGAGSGYFTFRLNKRVPEGRIYAVDLQPQMLAMIRTRMREEGADNVVPVRATEKSPELAPESIDAALFVDVYHELAYPHEVMKEVVAALKPGGRVYLVEYRAEDPTVMIKPLHKMTERQARKEMAAVGLTWVRTGDFLPQQHFLVFEKPAALE